ncbi:ATP-binding cassette domain-containing protein [Salinifilum aidingensis]
MTAAVEIVDLVKRYPKSGTTAVDGLTCTVHHGEIFGLLGPNGAGKTTTVGILTTRVVPTSGVARVADVDVARDPVGTRRHVAVVPQRVNLDRSLNVRQNLLWHAIYHGVDRRTRRRRADELLDRLGIAEKATSRVDHLSGGQSQRVMIARALMHWPAVLFLDEPSTGLDPQARLFVHERIAELRQAGVTVVLTTHDMDEAEKLSDRVGIVDHGKLLTLDTPRALIKSLPGSGAVHASLRADGHDAAEICARLGEVDGVHRWERIDDGDGAEDLRLRLYVAEEPATMLAPIARTLTAHDVDILELSPASATLEDVFIEHTGRELR